MTVNVCVCKGVDVFVSVFVSEFVSVACLSVYQVCVCACMLVRAYDCE